jgi:protein-S-isoprenylcysteine O-methyltransferase Ste14
VERNLSETLWKTAFVIGWLSVVGLRAYYQRLNKLTRTEKSYRTLPDMIVAICSILLALAVVPMLVVCTPWLVPFQMTLSISLRIVGLLGYFASILLLWWIHATLGKNFSPDLEIAENHQLITVGPYKYVRHPMYTQFLLWAVFQGLLLANSFVLVFGIVAWVFFYCVRMPAEEKMMLKKFGEEYDLYALKTGRLFPKIIMLR